MLIIPSTPSPIFPLSGYQSSCVSPAITCLGITILVQAINSSIVKDLSSKISIHIVLTPCGNKLNQPFCITLPSPFHYPSALPLHYFVPAGILAAVGVGVRLVDAVPDADPSVRVHAGHAIVLGELGLSDGDAEAADEVGNKRTSRAAGNDHLLLLEGHGCLAVGRLLLLLDGLVDAEEVAGKGAQEDLEGRRFFICSGSVWIRCYIRDYVVRQFCS